MDSLDAECLLMTMASEGGCAPASWCHRDDGSLACRFPDSSNELTWPQAAVTEMAERWRAEANHELPPGLPRLIAAHRAFASLIAHAELAPPDAVVHDLSTWEVRARWSDRKVEVVVEAGAGEDAPHRDAETCAS